MNIRILGLSIAALVAAGATLARAQGTDEPAGGGATTTDLATSSCVGTVKVPADQATDKAQWLQILPARQPPTTSRLSFDNRDGGHVEVAWDPYDGRGLARTIVLTGGDWQVSFWAEPQRDSMKFANNYAWQARGAPCNANWSAPETVVIVEERRDDKPAYVEIKLTGDSTLPKLAVAEAPAGVTAAPSFDTLRSFDVATLPSEAAELVVRVVTHAVKRKALRLATAKLKQLVCKTRAGLADDPTTAYDERHHLPRTCQAISLIDLRTLSAAARPVAVALTLDLSQRAVDKLALDDAIVKVPFEAIASGLVLLHGRPDLTAVDAQQLFATVVAGYFPSGASDATDAGRFAARLALRLIGHCAASGQCDLALLRRILDDPAKYFAGEVPAAYQARLTSHRALLEQLIADGRRVFDTARTVTNLDRLRAAMRASARAVAVHACFADAASCQKVTHLVALVEHMVQDDFAAALGELRSLGAQDLTQAQQARLTLFVNLVSQAAAVASGDAAERKRAADQVETALDAVLDDAADRHGRGGDWIWSIGTGLRATGAVKIDGGLRGPVSVPVALSLDRLCAKGDACCSFDGFHLEFGFLDVGNYLRIREVTNDDVDSEPIDWTDLANLSVGAGWLAGDVDMPMYFGLTGGIAPGTKESTGRRGWNGYLGAYVGVYFPIIDLN